MLPNKNKRQLGGSGMYSPLDELAVAPNQRLSSLNMDRTSHVLPKYLYSVVACKKIKNELGTIPTQNYELILESHIANKLTWSFENDWFQIEPLNDNEALISINFQFDEIALSKYEIETLIIYT